MKILKAIAIALLFIFAIMFPASLLVTDVGSQVASEERLVELTMTAALSNEALPVRIKETIWFHHWFSKKIDFGPRFLVTSIHVDQWGGLLNIALPLKQREELAASIIGGGFDWFENTAPYPDIRIELAPVLSTVNGKAGDVALWAINTLKTPQCKPERLKEIRAGDYGDDLTAVVSCKPPVADRQGVADHLAPMIRNMLDEANPPQTVDVGLQLKDRVAESELLATKAKLNQARKALPLVWILPVVILALALALVVRSRKQLMHWAGWSLLAGGVVGGIMAWKISNSAPTLEDLFLPPPAGIPPQAAPVVKAILSELLTGASGMMTWQLGIVFLAGAGLLVKFYMDVGRLDDDDS
jgi:hypothetical protein